jgi:hypothetical protein
MKSKSKEYKVSLRIVAVKPPVGYKFWMQDDKGNKINLTQSKGEDITFDFEASVKENRNTGELNFSGPFAKGTSSSRFFYVNNEGRRAKIWISGGTKAYVVPSPITWKMVKEVASDSSKVLMARYWGTGRDGGPNCATCELIDGGWVVASR